LPAQVHRQGFTPVKGGAKARVRGVAGGIDGAAEQHGIPRTEGLQRFGIQRRTDAFWHENLPFGAAQGRRGRTAWLHMSA
jgi:hypothetical protein